MGSRFWIAIARGIGGLILSGAAIFAAFHSSKQQGGKW